MRDPEFHTWSNAVNTFATIRIWDEAAWEYREVTEMVVGRDAAAEYRKLHSLMFIVLRIRYL